MALRQRFEQHHDGDQSTSIDTIAVLSALITAVTLIALRVF